MSEKIKFMCLFSKCNFIADVVWPKYEKMSDEDEDQFQASMNGTTELIRHHNDTRVKLDEYPGLGTGHSRFKGILPGGNEIKVDVSGDTAWVVEGFKFL